MSRHLTYGDRLYAGASLSWGAIAQRRVQGLLIVQDLSIPERCYFDIGAGAEKSFVDQLF